MRFRCFSTCHTQSIACKTLYFVFRLAKKDRHNALAVLSVLLPLIAAAIYYVYKSPIVFQVLFGVLVALGMFAMYKKAQSDKLAYTLALRSLFFFMLAFLIWNIDSLYCDHIRHARSFLTFPINALLQLHGWWHFLSALSFLHYLAAGVILEFRWIGVSLWYGLIPVFSMEKQSAE
jgi:hypothetical protein